MNNASDHDPAKIKQAARVLGADLCGVAPADRFAGAPPGHMPQDIFPDCRSVIVFAKRVPPGTLYAKTSVPYTQSSRVVNQELDRLANRLSLVLEDMGMRAVPIPADDPYEHWMPERQHGLGILSMRHAGHLAGLGVLGRNTLLKNDRYGNMLQIGAVLVDAEIEPDPLATYEACPDGCRRCIDSCPSRALDGVTVDQALCRPTSSITSPKGHALIGCYTCRRVCPHRQGMR